MATNKSLSGPQLLLISLALAGTAVICNLLYIGKIQQQASEATFKAFTLTRSMQPGEVLHNTDLKEVMLPKKLEASMIELGYVDSNGKETYLGSKFASTARQGELLQHRQFTSTEDNNIAEISTGKRLISLAINPRTAPAMLRAGVYVDIEGAFSTGGAIPEVITVMERIELKAVGSRTVNDEAAIAAGEKPRSGSTNTNTITIEVSPSDASVFAALQRIVQGSFELQIRNPNDREAPKLRDVATINPRLIEMVRQRQTEAGPGKPRS